MKRFIVPRIAHCSDGCTAGSWAGCETAWRGRGPANPDHAATESSPCTWGSLAGSRRSGRPRNRPGRV